MAFPETMKRLVQTTARYYIGGAVGRRIKRFTAGVACVIAALSFSFLGVFLLLMALLFQLAHAANWVFPLLIVGVISLLVGVLAAVQGSWLFRR